jgi:predicted lipase
VGTYQQSASAGFNPALARSLATYSQRAYFRKSTFRSPFFSAPGTDAGVLVDDYGPKIIIACPGTENIKDWIQDAKFKKVAPYGDRSIRVHDGFDADVCSIWPSLFEKVRNSQKALIFTGHSKGGAEATLMAYEFAKAGFDVETVYTFASPRVGNAGWRDSYDTRLGNKTFRVVACGDLVPHLPGMFTTPLDGYRHVGQEIFYEGPGRWFENPNRGFEILANDWRVAKAIDRGDFDFIVKLHSLTGDYIPLLV